MLNNFVHANSKKTFFINNYEVIIEIHKLNNINKITKKI